MTQDQKEEPLRSIVYRLTGEISGFKGYFERLSKDVDTLGDRANKTQNSITMMREHYRVHVKTMTDVQTRVERMVEKVDVLSHEVLELRTKFDAVIEDRSDCPAKFEDLESTCLKLKEDLQKLASTVERISKEMSELNAQVNAIKAEQEKLVKRNTVVDIVITVFKKIWLFIVAMLGLLFAGWGTLKDIFQ